MTFRGDQPYPLGEIRVGGGTYHPKVGAAPAVGTALDVQTESVLVAVNGSGIGTITFPHAFPNGLMSCPVAAGDTANGLGFAVTTAATLSTVTVQCYQPGGAACGAGTVRLEYTATGW